MRRIAVGELDVVVAAVVVDGEALGEEKDAGRSGRVLHAWAGSPSEGAARGRRWPGVPERDGGGDALLAVR